MVLNIFSYASGLYLVNTSYNWEHFLVKHMVAYATFFNSGNSGICHPTGSPHRLYRLMENWEKHASNQAIVIVCSFSIASATSFSTSSLFSESSILERCLSRQLVQWLNKDSHLMHEWQVPSCRLSSTQVVEIAVDRKRSCRERV